MKHDQIPIIEQSTDLHPVKLTTQKKKKKRIWELWPSCSQSVGWTGNSELNKPDAGHAWGSTWFGHLHTSTWWQEVWNLFCASVLLACCDLQADGHCHLSSAPSLAWQSSLCLASLAKSIRKHSAKLPAYHPPNCGTVAWPCIQGHPCAIWQLGNTLKNTDQHCGQLASSST